MDRLGGLAQARAVMAERGDLLGDLAARRADVVARTEAITGGAPAPDPSRSLTSTRTRSSRSGVSIERPWPPPGTHHSAFGSPAHANSASACSGPNTRSSGRAR